MDGESSPVASAFLNRLSERLERLISEAPEQEMKFLGKMTKYRKSKSFCTPGAS